MEKWHFSLKTTVPSLHYKGKGGPLGSVWSSPEDTDLDITLLWINKWNRSCIMDAYCMDRGWFCSGPTVKLCVWLRQVFQSKTEALNLSCINFIGYNIWGPQISTGAGHRKKKQPHTQKAIVGIWFRDLPNRQWEHNCNRYLVETGRKKKKNLHPVMGNVSGNVKLKTFWS